MAMIYGMFDRYQEHYTIAQEIGPTLETRAKAKFPTKRAIARVLAPILGIKVTSTEAFLSKCYGGGIALLISDTHDYVKPVAGARQLTRMSSFYDFLEIGSQDHLVSRTKKINALFECPETRTLEELTTLVIEQQKRLKEGISPFYR